MGKSRRNHYLPQFYQRNFTISPESKNIRVLSFDSLEWNDSPLTPHGVGWLPDLYSIPETEGTDIIDDQFETKFFQKLDSEMSGPIKKAATYEGAVSLTEGEKRQVARFIAYLVSRNPQVIDSLIKAFADPKYRHIFIEQEKYADILRADTKNMAARLHFNKLVLEGVEGRAETRADEFCAMKWKVVKTGPENPFVTSDMPVFGQMTKGIVFCTCPISSTVSFIITDAQKFHERNPGGIDKNVAAMNDQTTRKAKRFLISSRTAFAGIENIKKSIEWRRQQERGSRN